MKAHTERLPNSPRVFISYARSDGQTFANDLRQRLETEGISLWQDRVPSGARIAFCLEVMYA